MQWVEAVDMITKFPFIQNRNKTDFLEQEEFNYSRYQREKKNKKKLKIQKKVNFSPFLSKFLSFLK